MPTPYDDPTRAFERELRRAERERRRLVALAGLAGVAVVGLAVIVVTIQSVRGASTAKVQAPKQIESAQETAPSESPTAREEQIAEEPVTEAPATSAAEKPAATAKPKPTPEPEVKPAVQRLSVGLGQYGYDPETLNAKAGIPIKLTVAKGEGCAAGFLMPGLNVSADNSKGPATIDLPALDAGSYQFMCAMQMVSGTLVVK